MDNDHLRIVISYGVLCFVYRLGNMRSQLAHVLLLPNKVSYS